MGSGQGSSGGRRGSQLWIGSRETESGEEVGRGDGSLLSWGLNCSSKGGEEEVSKTDAKRATDACPGFMDLCDLLSVPSLASDFLNSACESHVT